MKTIVLVLFAFFSFVVVAQEPDVNTSGLTAEQVQALRQTAEQMKGKPLPTADKVKEYAEVGEMIGKAMSSTAKEMNIAVNEFSQTPVGKVCIFLIVWKLFGRELLHFIVGGLMLAIGLFLWCRYYRRMCIVSKEEMGQGWWIFRERKCQYFDAKDSDVQATRWAMAFILLLMVAGCMLCMWT